MTSCSNFNNVCGRVSFASFASLLSVTAFVAPAHAQCTAGWVQGIGIGGTNDAVRSLDVLPDGDVVAGGSFVTAAGIPAANRIARYSPSTGVWSSLGTGTNSNIVYAIEALPDGRVFAGGNFAAIGGVTVNRIGLFDFGTQTWSGIGYGTNGGAVYDIQRLPNGNIVIGGRFNRVAGSLMQHVALYNMTTGVWTTLNSGFNSSPDQVDAIAVAPNGDIVVGGVLYNATGVVGVNNVARYSFATGTWSGLGTGVNNSVTSVVVLPDGDVIVGGSFTVAGGVTVGRIARYNPASNTWSSMNGGVSGHFNTVKALALLPNGNVVAAGSFAVAGGVGASRIALYNPTTNTWSAMGSGVNSDVESLTAHPSGDVIAGGFFTNAGGVSASRIARYSFGGTTPAIATNPEDAAACAAGAVSLTVSAGGSQPLTYQWRKDSIAIDTVANPSAATATLMLANLEGDDAGFYDCVVSNSCGSDTSAAAELRINTSDFDGDGDAGTDSDIEAFFACLAGTCCPTCATSDFDADGDAGTDSDIEAFFRVLAGGVC